MRQKFWADEEIKMVINLYPTTITNDLCKILNRSKSSIECMANKLNLHKTKAHISANIARRNKIVFRDLSYDFCKNEAKKYISKKEFKLNDYSCYLTAQRAGYLNEICSHMICGYYSTPQLFLFNILCILFPNINILYNDRKAIYPKELDVYIKDYNLAFEYNGKHWHSDIHNKNKEILCKEKNIILITINEKNKNYKKYIYDIKESIIENMDKLNLNLEKKITKENILNINEKDIYCNYLNNITNEENIIKITSSFNTIKEFKTLYPKMFYKLRDSKLLEKYCSHMKPSKIRWNIDLCKKEINKYIFINDFIQKSKGCYLYIYKHNLSYLLMPLKYKNNCKNKLIYKI